MIGFTKKPVYPLLELLKDLLSIQNSSSQCQQDQACDLPRMRELRKAISFQTSWSPHKDIFSIIIIQLQRMKSSILRNRFIVPNFLYIVE